MSIARLKIRTSALSILAAAVLTACGGGGDVDTPAAPTTPVDTPATAVPGVSVPLLTSLPTTTYAANSPEKSIFDQVNAERMKCGFGAIKQNTLLDAAARNHANYIIANKEYNHVETADKAEFTGKDVTARAKKVGYVSIAKMSEGISFPYFTETLEFSVRTQLSAPYHSQTMLAEYTEMGIGFIPSKDGFGTTVFTFGSGNLSIGQLPSLDGNVRTYPCEGVSGVNPALYGEQPSPTYRTLAKAPAGHPIMVIGDYKKVLTITSASVIEVPTGRSLPIHRLSTWVNDINSSILRGSHVGYVLPDVPMRPNTTYSVTISGTNDGKAFTRNFNFGTGNDWVKPPQ